jgi:glucan biosynthesis protein C
MLWEIAIALSHGYFLARPSGLAYLMGHGVDPYLRYLPFFLLGLVLRAVPALRASVIWQGGWILPVIATTSAIAASLLRGRDGLGLEILYNAADAIAAILMSAVLIGCATRFWNRPSQTVDRIVDASFTIYLLHHPMIYGLVTLLLLVAWPPVVEFAIVCLVTLAVSYTAHQILRKSRLALFLFNGISLRANASPSAPTAPVEGTLR